MASISNGSLEMTSLNVSAPDDMTELMEMTDEVSSLTLATQIFVGTFLSAIIILAVSGNILVCVAVLTDRNLRKIGNLYIVSLSFADMTLAGAVMTFALTNDLLEYWPFGAQFCDVWIAFDVLCSTASILNLCAISLDRYIHIKDPLRYGRLVTRRVVTLSIAAIWLMAVLVSFVPISLDLHRPPGRSAEPVDERGLPQCALDLTPLYAVVSSCISFYVPCVVMLAIYSRLYLYAKRHVESIKALTKPVMLGTIDGVAPPPACNRCHVSEGKAATTVGIIVGVFLVCYVPFFCVNIVAAFCKTCVPRLAFQTLSWFGYSNSSFNPIIYSIFNVEFREAFVRIFGKVRGAFVRLCQRAGVPTRPRQPSQCKSVSSMTRLSTGAVVVDLEVTTSERVTAI
ncbi:Dopamine receptor 1 [Amphibalanus amphitrite]|uniref:Dopamine receptor 1 n=1 Tax=Amphibalanus amphitrite TaxID=1232801 RepID=A0A6A4WF40_AMPAM|nr:dopamine receptor 1-like [Amphibalanus amphitrite]KAF0304613.1 Dopamine receptor 1 [Amphibalanus amphitrite]